ncbi:MAG: type II toxin-antitoxin system Phd/YefM family antitoxin [Kiritimatiellae bacterium]|nr:type II toxin-antitoxin system Phd/YefM family antitoxin [Kiritimatiellia bacterium]
MPNVNYAEDIVPLSSFRSDVTRLMSQTRQTHRPIVVTQNGRAANVFLDVSDYQALIDKLDLLMDLNKGEKDISAGRIYSTDDARRIVAADLGVCV